MAPHELYIWSSKLLQIPLSYFFWYTHTNLELVGTQGTFSSFGKSLMKILFSLNISSRLNALSGTHYIILCVC